MNIAVCIKQVPDTETVIKILPDGKGIETEGIKYVLNPYDEFAVEEALQIKEQSGGEVILYSLGPKRVEEALRTCLAMGGDRAVHLLNEKNSDPYSSAAALARTIEGTGYDLILCGKEAVDDNCGQAGGAIAEILNVPHISLVTGLNLDIENRKGTAVREIEGGTEHVEFIFPAVVTCQKGLNDPRLPSLKGIMAAKKKVIELVTPDPVSLVDKTRIISYFSPPARPVGKIFAGDAKEAVKNVVRLLREEAKVI